MSYAGDITPQESWELLSQNPDSVLVDVRTSAEWNWVGRPDLTELGKEVVFVEWNTAEAPTRASLPTFSRRASRPAIGR